MLPYDIYMVNIIREEQCTGKSDRPFRCAQTFLMTEATPFHAQPGDEQSIRKFNDDWAAAMQTKDVAQLAGMVTDDVVFLPPGFPAIRGRQFVEAMYTNFFAQTTASSRRPLSTKSKWRVNGPLPGEPSISSWFRRPAGRRF
jgi:hypothetical protein